jgi:hypothetical protein
MSEHEKWADIVIVQGHALEIFPSLEKSDKILVVDVYDPMHLEQLEQGRSTALTSWNKQVNDATQSLNHQLALGDFFLCASEQQRHFWLGQLAALGRINAFTYSRDNDLNSLIAIAPFGIPDEAPVRTGAGIRGVVPGVGADEKVIVWAGGIYDWFDPETLIRAVGRVAESHGNVRLFFMGVKHPHPGVPEMKAVAHARSVARDLGLLGSVVIFNESWVPYEERQNYLLDADLGVSTHFQHVETTFSFRTRILDYLWSGLPILTTGGDSFARLVEAESLGAVVPERDEIALANAIERLLYTEEAAGIARENVVRVREQFHWQSTLAPLVEFCREPIPAADKEATSADGKAGRRKTDSSQSLYVPSKPVTGLRRDMQRVAYYLGEGGPAAVVERYRARRQRKRNSGM